MPQNQLVLLNIYWHIQRVTDNVTLLSDNAFRRIQIYIFYAKVWSYGFPDIRIDKMVVLIHIGVHNRVLIINFFL